MKAIIIYSGKGGVGKTTTTANIARLLAKQGNKVFIIDADINTPSMNTEFEGDHPHEMIREGILNYQESVIKQVKETWCCSLMKSCQ